MDKKYQCKECKKEYCRQGWARRHSKNTGHFKFKQIKEDEFKFTDES
jgi:hypothetical protein